MNSFNQTIQLCSGWRPDNITSQKSGITKAEYNTHSTAGGNSGVWTHNDDSRDHACML